MYPNFEKDCFSWIAFLKLIFQKRAKKLSPQRITKREGVVASELKGESFQNCF